jgi:hypothetical protein
MKTGDYISYQNLICQIITEIENKFYLLWFVEDNPSYGFCENISLARTANPDEVKKFMEQRDNFLLQSIQNIKSISNQNIRILLNENYDWRLIKNERKAFLGETPDDLTTHHLEAKRILDEFGSYCDSLDSIVPYTEVGLPPLSSIQNISYNV